MVFDSDARASRASSSTATTTSPSVNAFRHEMSMPIPLRVPTPEDIVLLKQATCLRDFVSSYREIESYKNGAPIALTGEHLTISAVAAIARYPELVGGSIDNALAALKSDQARLDKLAVSRAVIDDKIAKNKSIYGVSTGFGGSADTRTAQHGALGYALLQHQHAGILPTALEGVADAQSVSSKPDSPLPLGGPLATLSMPAAWTRAAMIVRLNSLLRGHSAASLPLLSAMGSLLSKQITPIVPLRGTISASGDLAPLSYVAGTLIGERGIYCYAPGEAKVDGALGLAGTSARVLRASEALKTAGIEPLSLKPKEHLAILNGTAFSCGAAALCVEESRQLMLLSTVCTALGTEALQGSADSFCEFIQRIRPHPGQVETGTLLSHLLASSKLATRHGEPAKQVHDDGLAESCKDVEEETIDEDAGTLRQDRYPLRTAPQYLGPQIEIVQRSAETIAIECNSTTDNPLIDPDMGIVHHGGNFQAMAVTTALEPLRLALFHVGKLLFAQSTELQNPTMNHHLPGNLASTDPSINFFGKGIDIAMAAYVGELAYLATPVSTGVQSAEMHNQAVNSLALINARYTFQAIDIVQLIIASYLYLLCQAVDLRALQKCHEEDVRLHVAELVKEHFRAIVDYKSVADAVWSAYETSANMDARPRAEKAARASTQPLVDALLTNPESLSRLPSFQAALASAIFDSNHALVHAYLFDSQVPGSARYLPATPLLGRTRRMYEFIRRDLGIGMHGKDNFTDFENGLSQGMGGEDRTIGAEISVIYEAIRDGRMKGVIVDMFGTD